MKNWSLHAKLTVWSALIVAVALLLCGSGAILFVQHEQIEALDEQLANEAGIFLGAVERSGLKIDWTQRTQIEALLPRTHTGRFVEVVSTEGRSLYRSKEPQTGQLPRLPAGMHTVRIGKDDMRLGVFTTPEHTLYFARQLNEIEADATQLIVVGLVGLQLLIGLAILGGWWLSRQALEPVREITAAAEQITTAHLDRRLPAPRVHDEVGRLTDVLNAMFDRLDAGFRQAARFSADASHELWDPLESTCRHASLSIL